MTRTAIYSAEDNSLKEISQMGKPDSKDYTRVVHRPFGEVDCFTDKKYYEDLKLYNAHIASLRTIPCSPEPGFIDQQIYEEGKDYEVKGAGDWKWCSRLKGNVFAAPLSVQSEDELTLIELEEPIGNFILNQEDIKPVMAPDGAYYHYKDVCTMLVRYRHYKPKKQ